MSQSELDLPLLPRDRQRHALQTLARLATESGSEQARIDDERRDTLAAAEDRLTRGLWAVKQRADAARQQLADKHTERLSAAGETHRGELEQLDIALSTRRQRVIGEHDATSKDIKKRFDQGLWLADSVLEATQAQFVADEKAAKRARDDELESLQKTRNEATATLHEFGAAYLADEPAETMPSTTDEPPAARLTAWMAQANDEAKRLASLKLPRLFTGVWPFVLVVLIVGGTLAYTHFQLRGGVVDGKALGVAGGSAAGAVLVVGVLVKLLANRQVRDSYRPLAVTFATAAATIEEKFAAAAEERDARDVESHELRAAEVKTLKQRFAPLQEKANQRRATALAALDAESFAATRVIEDRRAAAAAEADEWKARHDAEASERFGKQDDEHRRQHVDAGRDAEGRYQAARDALEASLVAGLQRTTPPSSPENEAIPRDWTSPAWEAWQPTRRFAPSVPIGHLAVDLHALASASANATPTLKLPDAFEMPVVLALPQQASLLIEHDRAARDRAIGLLQMSMLRVLTSLPPGRAKFTICDPVGLGQSFAGFMHLADYDDSLVNGRIWTESDQINKRLDDLTEHMETVIQKYLRNEFATIDDYNAQAGELAEPYRFLVLADFPSGFHEESVRRLSSIAASGARCGVYFLIACDKRAAIPAGMHLEDLELAALTVNLDGKQTHWKDDVFGKFPVTLDGPASEELLTKLIHKVGRGAKEAARVEVPFDAIAPKADEFFSRSTRDDLAVPIGRAGATRLQQLRLGKGVAQHTLIAGKTGSGKSTLLNAIVTNAAMWFPPDELEFYLVDFKKGVEFKAYAAMDLPHARAIAVESDREFGLSVLQRLDAELTRRGELFRKAGVQDLANFRNWQADAIKGNTADAEQSRPMPRTLLIIDEFQEFFSEDDKLAQDAALLLDRLVRQGRAFGVHVLLGSQTIGGSSGLSRATLGQMAVRVALQCSDADSQIILGDANTAARLLTRPGEAIYNDQGGLVEANSPFQIAWLPDAQREAFLRKVRDKAAQLKRRYHREPASVFEGNQPAELARNRQLARMLTSPAAASSPLAYLGDPVAIKEPTAAIFRRQSSANLLVVGQADELALGVLASSIVSLTPQLAAGGEVVILDGVAADSPLAGRLLEASSAAGAPVRSVEYRDVPAAIERLHALVVARTENDHRDAPAVFLVVAGLQRFRQLRKAEEDFGMSFSSEPKAVSTGKLFADLLRDGPPVGVHVIAWIDTHASIDRTLDRGSLREFDQRVLFQMSANDSSTLIDSPAANRLGFYRAISFSEEGGVMEKFRPYALASTETIAAMREASDAEVA